MRVLVYGGSFDPPHLGHASLLLAAAKKIRPNKILILPAYQAPLKATPQASAEDRLAMTRLGVLNRLPSKWRKISRLDPREARTRRKVFTVETLKQLASEFNDAELHFAVGLDSALTFSKWKDPARLKTLAKWWYGSRPRNIGRPDAHFHRIPGSFPDVSSTDIRSKLALGDDCTMELLPSVSSYIDRRGLYGRKILSVLKSTLSPDRYAHTLNVASLAESLARRHGADPLKARLAGLLHDAGRRYPPPLLAAYVRRRRLAVPGKAELIALDPMLLHAYVSADLAKREFNVADPEILGAVRRHTLGDRRMGLLDSVLYVADACSKDRAHAGAAAVRALAFMDLNAALKRCVAAKILHAVSREAWLHPLTITLWNSLARL